MLEILSVVGPAWVQDLGRPGHMHEGMPWGGALVPELLLAANARLGNAAHAAGIEFYGSITLRCSVPMAIEHSLLPPGVVHELRPSRDCRVACVAVQGGLDVPYLMGGRGTYPAAQIGGFDGRALQARDQLRLLTSKGSSAILDCERGRIALPDFTADVPVLPGPDIADFRAGNWQTFLNSRWVLSNPSDRSGTRLQGPRLDPNPRANSLSVPAVAGAVQVPPSGQPIVLGPDHPVTGGYPVIAVVSRASLGVLHGRRIGATVRFIAAPARDYPKPTC